jgi:hypothetical protein
MANRKQALLAELRGAHADALALIERLTPEQLTRPVNEGWSVRDLLAHLASIDTRLRAMWQHALDGGDGPVPGPSLDDFNAACVAERRRWTVSQLKIELQDQAEATRGFVEHLPPEALDQRWTHPVRGEVTVESLLWIAPRHLREHLAEITTAVG